MTTSSKAHHIFAPGRTEIAGNHTDHEGGHVIAAAIDAGVDVTARSRDDRAVVVTSVGYETCCVRLDEPGVYEPRADERGTTTAIVRGVLAGLHAEGVSPAGFEASLTSNLPAGGGLSSSAAVELAVALAACATSDARTPHASTLARIGQQAERDFFGKPCGLMDQLAVAFGGVCAIDFADPEAPAVDEIPCDLEELGLDLVLVDVGCDHSRFTSEYEAVAREMGEVARLFGAQRLCDVGETRLLQASSSIRSTLGDRAFLRALHFCREERLTKAREEALRAGDSARFLALTRMSGASSAMYLQNVSAPGTEQPAMTALAFAEHVIDFEIEVPAEGAAAPLRGAVRIHGGGFGGSVQAFVPQACSTAFIRGMEDYLGRGCARVYRIGVPGARILDN